MRNRERVISIGVARIELNDTTELVNRLFLMPKPALDEGDRIDDINVIRKTLFSLLEFRQPPGEIALPPIAITAKSKVRFRQVRIERESMIEGILGCCQPRRAWIESLPVTLALRTGEICPSQHKIGIQLHGLLI